MPRSAVILIFCLIPIFKLSHAAADTDSGVQVSIYAGVADVYETQTASRNGVAARLGASRRVTMPFTVGGEVAYYGLGSDYTGCPGPNDPNCPLTYNYNVWNLSLAGRLEADLGDRPRPYVVAGTGFYSLAYKNQIEGVRLHRSSELGFSIGAGMYRFWLADLGAEVRWHSIRDGGSVIEGRGTSFYTLTIGINATP